MDEIIRAVSADGFVKMQVITARATVQRAQDIHHLTPTTSAALGRTLCAASMLGELMKEDDASLTIRVQGGGPIGSVIAVSDSEGNVRGVVGDASVDLPLRPDGSAETFLGWTVAAATMGFQFTPARGGRRQRDLGTCRDR